MSRDQSRKNTVQKIDGRDMLRIIAVRETEVTLLFMTLLLIASTTFQNGSLANWEYIGVVGMASGLALARWLSPSRLEGVES